MEVAVAVTESAEPQPIVEAGRRVADLVALQSRSRGRVELDLGSPIIARGTMTAETTFHARAGRVELLRESTTELSLTGVVREGGP
jgi:antitoxin (DNA-binding transcriptional repressor) of toxin-antitoxin stability system